MLLHHLLDSLYIIIFLSFVLLLLLLENVRVVGRY